MDIENCSLKNLKHPDSPYFASTKYEHLIQEISEFESSLDEDSEIVLQLASFGTNITMNVTDLGFQNPDILLFYGYVNGKKSELIQHISQLNFMLSSAEKNDKSKPPRRIGFKNSISSD